MVIMSKLYLVLNIIRKIELIQKVSILECCMLLRKTTMLCACEIMRRASTYSRFNGLKFSLKYYTDYSLPTTYCSRSHCIYLAPKPGPMAQGMGHFSNPIRDKVK